MLCNVTRWWIGVVGVVKLVVSYALPSVMPMFFFLMIRRPPGATQSRSSAASDVYKRQVLFASIIVIPLILLLAVAVALDGSSPFYWNDRVGRGGRTFRMLKLRTMVPNADTMLERYLDRNPEARLEWNSTQKLKSDPRITGIGRFLRKTSLDELPQLWNVFIGDMSLAVSYTHLTLPTIYSV